MSNSSVLADLVEPGQFEMSGALLAVTGQERRREYAVMLVFQTGEALDQVVGGLNAHGDRVDRLAVDDELLTLVIAQDDPPVFGNVVALVGRNLDDLGVIGDAVSNGEALAEFGGAVNGARLEHPDEQPTRERAAQQRVATAGL